MKIIFSPTKTLNLEKTQSSGYTYLFKEETNKLFEIFNTMTMDQIQEVFSLKSVSKTIEVFNYYHDFSKRSKAIDMYDGPSFRQLEISNYLDDDLKYLNDRLRIISALYGVLRPYDIISPYRLDFKTKLDFSITKYWKDIINIYFASEDVLINLASKEFSNLLNHKNMITIDFKQQKGDKLSSISSLSKQARGMYLNWMIKNKISVDRLSLFNEGDYKFIEEESNENYLLFIKEII